MAQLKTSAIRLCVPILALTVLLSGLEIALAILQINTKSNVRFIDKKGTTYLPGAYYRHTKEGFSEGYFNSHGFRDRERSYEKPANTYRIVILGDSQVEALQVSLADSFPALLEKTLNEHSSSLKFEVLSLGQSGFGTADEYMRFIDFGVNYSPDMVLLTVTTANDIQDNSKYLCWEDPRFYFVFDKQGNLVLDASLIDAYGKDLTLPKRLFQRLKRHSYLANLISERVLLLRNELRRARFEANASEVGRAEETKNLHEFSGLNIYLSELSPHWQEAFEITKQSLLKLKASVGERKARFVVVTNPGSEQVYPERAKQLSRHYGLAFDFEQPDRILGDFARQQSITFFSLMPAFRKYHHETRTYLHGFGSSIQGHWNEHGHRLAAEEIYQFLTERRLVPLDGSKK